MDNQKLEDLAKRLWKKHPEALNYLAERRPDPISDFKAYLTDNADNLAAQLSEIDGGQKISYISNSPRSNIRFCVDGWAQLDGLASGDGTWTSNGCVLAFELYLASKGQYALASLIGPGDDDVRERLHTAAQGIKGFNRWNLGKKWFQLKRWDLVNDLEKLLDQKDLEEAFDVVDNEMKSVLSSRTGIPGHLEMLEKAGFVT